MISSHPKSGEQEEKEMCPQEKQRTRKKEKKKEANTLVYFTGLRSLRNIDCGQASDSAASLMPQLYSRSHLQPTSTTLPPLSRNRDFPQAASESAPRDYFNHPSETPSTPIIPSQHMSPVEDDRYETVSDAQPGYDHAESSNETVQMK
jgi:hypothetical protein